MQLLRLLLVLLLPTANSSTATRSAAETMDTGRFHVPAAAKSSTGTPAPEPTRRRSVGVVAAAQSDSSSTSRQPPGDVAAHRLFDGARHPAGVPAEVKGLHEPEPEGAAEGAAAAASPRSRRRKKTKPPAARTPWESHGRSPLQQFRDGQLANLTNISDAISFATYSQATELYKAGLYGAAKVLLLDDVQAMLKRGTHLGYTPDTLVDDVRSLILTAHSLELLGLSAYQQASQAAEESL